MKIKIEGNFGDFERQLKRAAGQAIDERAREHQAAFDAVASSYRGRSAADVALEIRRRLGGRLLLSDDQLQRYAEAISEGRRVRVEVDSSGLR